MSDTSDPENLLMKFMGVSQEEIDAQKTMEEYLREALRSLGITIEGRDQEMQDKATMMGLAVQRGDPQAVGLFVLAMLGWLKTQGPAS